MDKKRLGSGKRTFPSHQKFYRRHDGGTMSKGKDICGRGNFFTSLETKS